MRFPRTVYDLAHADKFHATLTEVGLKKIQNARRNGDEAPHMLPGRDYKVKDEAPPEQRWEKQYRDEVSGAVLDRHLVEEARQKEVDYMHRLKFTLKLH